MRLKFAVGCTKAFKVAASGAVRATECGAAVDGVSDDELEKLQSIALAGSSPSTPGRSKTEVLAIRGDVTWDPATAPIQQWIRTVLRSGGKDASKATQQDLSQAWKEGASNRHSVFATDGSIRWSQVRSPIGAMRLSLDRIAWHTDDGAVFIDGHHQKHRGFHAPDVETAAESRRPEAAQEQPRPRNGLPRIPRETILHGHRKENLQIQQDLKGGARLVVAKAGNAVWTRKRAQQAGYTVEDTRCELCGAHGDTTHGRVWKCEHPPVKVAREAVSSRSIIKAALQADPDSALYNRGFFAHPTDDNPQAADDTVGHFAMGRLAGSATSKKRDGLSLKGSCDQHMITDLRRAGWGAVAVGDEGNVMSVARGVIPADTIQSSQSGEYGALAGFAFIAIRVSQIFNDCANVVTAWGWPRLQRQDGRGERTGSRGWAKKTPPNERHHWTQGREKLFCQNACALPIQPNPAGKE